MPYKAQLNIVLVAWLPDVKKKINENEKEEEKKISMESDLSYLWSNYCKKLNKKYKEKNVYLSIYVYKKK